VAEDLRNIFPGLKILTHCGTGNFSKQLKKADKSGARFCLILGETELAENKITIKYLREQREQTQIAIDQLPHWLEKSLE